MKAVEAHGIYILSHVSCQFLIPESWNIKIWSWVQRHSELRMTVLARTSSNLIDLDQFLIRWVGFEENDKAQSVLQVDLGLRVMFGRHEQLNSSDNFKYRRLRLTVVEIRSLVRKWAHSSIFPSWASRKQRVKSKTEYFPFMSIKSIFQSWHLY
jgi:hypothetical protein